MALPLNNTLKHYKRRSFYGRRCLFFRCSCFKTIYETLNVGRDSSVSIATSYGLGGPGIESRWRRVFHTGPGVYPTSCTVGTGSFQVVKRWGRGAVHPPLYKRRGHERVELYLCSPSGPQWPVIGRTFMNNKYFGLVN